MPPLIGRRASAIARQRAAHPPARLGWLVFWMSGTLLAFIVAALSVRALARQPQRLRDDDGAQRRRAGHPVRARRSLRPGLLRQAARAPHARCRPPATSCISARRSAGRSRSRCCRSRPCSRSNSPFRPGSTLLAVLFLGERMTATRASALALCFARRAGDPAARPSRRFSRPRCSWSSARCCSRSPRSSPRS